MCYSGTSHQGDRMTEQHQDVSNGEWGHYGNNTQAPDRAPLYHEWSQYQEIQDAAVPPSIESFLSSRGITAAGMRAMSGRWFIEKNDFVLAFLFPDAIKYRTITNPPRRWASTGVKWRSLKVVGPVYAAKAVIVVEGETDGACCVEAFPEYAVAVLPSGAMAFTNTMVDQLTAFSVPVLVGLDNDPAGDEGSAVILDTVPGAKRVRAPGGTNDWCEAKVAGALDEWDPLENAIEPERLPVFSLREVSVADLGSYEDNNWFEQDVLPKGGSCIIHAPQKSLKSVIMLDMIRALATGTAFAGEYGFVAPTPPRVLLFQMEIRPEGFQRRVQGWLEQMHPERHDQYLDNTFVYKIVDGELPRIKIGNKDFRSTVMRAIDQVGATVVAFDPLQRLTGSADINAANELEDLLDFFAELQNAGITVLACHHNNKASGDKARGAYAMTGSQRFAADADSICSVWYSDECGDDENDERRKRRNFTWTLRNGAATGRSITVVPAANSELMYVEFGPLLTSETQAVEAGDPSIV